jgi:hypothetical protein
VKWITLTPIFVCASAYQPDTPPLCKAAITGPLRCDLDAECCRTIRLKSVSEKLGLSLGEYLASCHQRDLKRLAASFSGRADRSRRSHQRTAVYRRSRAADNLIDLPAPRTGTDQPLAPIENLGPRRHFAGPVRRVRAARLLAGASQSASLAQPGGGIPTIRQAVMWLDEWRETFCSRPTANGTADGTYLLEG